MSAHNSSHGASKKEKARVEAQQARARQAKKHNSSNAPSMPLFDGPKKVQNNFMDLTSQKIQKVLGSYDEVKPYAQAGAMIGVPRAPTTPLITDIPNRPHFPSSRHNNGQHKPTDRKIDPNRSLNFPTHSSREATTTSSSNRKSLPHNPSSISSQPSHARSSSASPPPFSHSSPAKQNQSSRDSRPSVSPVAGQRSKSLVTDVTNQKTEKLSHSSHNSKPLSPLNMPPSQNSKPSSHGPKVAQVLPNGALSDQAKSQRNNLPKLVIPEINKKADIQVLDAIFNEMTNIQPPLTGIQTPRKAEDKFPFPAQKTSSNCLSLNTSSESLKEEKDQKKKNLTTNLTVPDKTQDKPKTDLADRKGGATKECRIKRDRAESSSSESSSSSSSESESESDSNNSDDEEEEEEKKEELEEKDESIKELEKSTDSVSSKELSSQSQPSEPRWSLDSFIEKSKTSPIPQMSSGTKPGSSGIDKIHDDNNALLDEMVKYIPCKKLESIGHSSTLPFDVPLSEDDDDVTVPGCDIERFQNGAHSDHDLPTPSSVKNPPSICSPYVDSSCSSDDTSSSKITKPAQKHKLTKQRRQSSSNKLLTDKPKKDSKSSNSKKSHSSDNKPSDVKSNKEEKKRKSTGTKRKKPISREIVDTDSDIDVDVVSVTPGKHTAPMSSMLSDHNQNDKFPVTKQLFSPKRQSSPESKLNNSQSSVSSKSSSKHRSSDRDREKILYKEKHKNNVKKIKPQIYNSSDEDESTDCGQEVEDILESTEDFRPPSLHSPLPPFPYPCKDIKTSPSDTKHLVSFNSSIKPLKPSSVKNVTSPKSECAVKKLNHNVQSDISVKTPVVVKINLSLLKKNHHNSPSASRKLVSEDKAVKVKKENGNSLNDQIEIKPESKSSESSMSKETSLKKTKKETESVDDSISSMKKDVSNVSKSSSPAKVPKKESDSTKSSSIKTESESSSSHSKKSSKKDSDSSRKDNDISRKDSDISTTNSNSNSRDTDIKKEKDLQSVVKKEKDSESRKEKDSESRKEKDSESRKEKDSESRKEKDSESRKEKDSDIKIERESHSKRESKDSKSDSKESSRTKESKPHKRKNEGSHSESAKKHKSGSKSSSSSKRSSHENGVDLEGDEKRPPSRSERRNSTSSTSSRHNSKSHSKKPKLESKTNKDDKSSSKKDVSHQNGGENHLPFSNYSDAPVTSSPSKPNKLSTNKPALPSDELDPADHYLTRAKELKHQADSQKDKPVQMITYTEAVLAFIQCGYAMERRKLSEPLRIFTMYTETLQLLKSICRFRHDQSSHDKKLSVIILRIQALLCLKLYKLKKTEALKFKKIIDQHDQNKSSKPSYAPSPHQGSFNNRSTGIPSPMSPTPSPAGSIGSVGSQGSCELSTGKVTNGTSSLNTGSTPMASPGSVSIPQRIYSVQQQYFNISSFLVNAMEYWDQADQAAAENRAFFDHLDKVVGPLMFTHSGFQQLVTYVEKGLQFLRDT
ncbi:AF4/FMR2 family member 4 isoform X2 [Patella vulgata]|uniref:AF4/FMR2 family member 4 isoform X2 n=1 Tax=Patella vulgata TaxID=6465 RepID=UPI0021806661|nr:AF4/FMR2 family member 4 isoform X2 [Patella vulgata]